MKKQKLTLTIDPHKISLFLFVISLILLGYILGNNQEILSRVSFGNIFRRNGGNTISIKNFAKTLEKKNFTLINVHTPYEGEIEKTDAFIPYNEIPSSAALLPKDKNAPIILYCKTGRMSSEALETIKKLGYTNVRHLTGGMDAWQKNKKSVLDLSTLEQEVTPAEGIELPVSWGDIGPRLIKLGVIDEEKFKETVKLTPEEEIILTQGSEEKIKITPQNSQFIVDMLWAIGLAQKSIVYEEGPMGKEYKNDAGNFASTGGWTLARGSAVQYMNRFDLIDLSPDQQKKVGDIAQNVYRPCCGNSTWFPDCNHGMAALAAIELMVAAGISDGEIYRFVLALNSYWFSQSYLTVATYFARQGVSWKTVDAKTVLGKEFSSGQGAQETAAKVGPLPYKPETGGGGCGA